MELKQLEYFRAIVEEGTVSGAACVLHMTQPPLSYQGNLKAEYTIEGMHITEEGYRSIFPEFMKYAMESKWM